LTEEVRGKEKSPGEFRRSQNWIGGAGSALKNARYIPPSVEDMAEAMSGLEKYFNAGDEPGALTRAALIHYQFEAIHPFLDGNGRAGRLLITLFLLEKGVLSVPALHISYFLKKNRIEYCDRMAEVRNKGNCEQWAKFFLQAVLESVDNAVGKIQKLSALHAKNAEAISRMGRAAKNAMLLLSYLEANPVTEIQKAAAALGLSFNTVSAAVKRLYGESILVQSETEQRSRIFSYTDCLGLLHEGT
jgi:Fic family protein